MEWRGTAVRLLCEFNRERIKAYQPAAVTQLSKLIVEMIDWSYDSNNCPYCISASILYHKLTLGLFELQAN